MNRGLVSARHVDHVGMTVPNLDEAIQFFEGALGAKLLWRVRAQHQLRKVLVSMLAEIVPTREIVVGRVNTKVTDGRFTDEESIEHLERGLERLLSYIRARQLSDVRC